MSAHVTGHEPRVVINDPLRPADIVCQCGWMSQPDVGLPKAWEQFRAHCFGTK